MDDDIPTAKLGAAPGRLRPILVAFAMLVGAVLAMALEPEGAEPRPTPPRADPPFPAPIPDLGLDPAAPVIADEGPDIGLGTNPGGRQGAAGRAGGMATTGRAGTADRAGDDRDGPESEASAGPTDSEADEADEDLGVAIGDDDRSSRVDGAVAPSGEIDLLGPSPPYPDLDATEREIVRLTNALRADPAGPLAREGPLPDCIDDEFYRITIDTETGHPVPVPALTVDELVSDRMAQAWAEEMDEQDRFVHRPRRSQEALYDELGLDVGTWGENIAWFAGYPFADSAQTHFEGWRESDTGHYCALITGRFTHIGVGEHRRDDESWAVQNFYSLAD